MSYDRKRVVKVIHFEDNGQDFLRWGLDSQGYVRTCEPFQGMVWCNRRLHNYRRLKVGAQPLLSYRRGTYHYRGLLPHKIIKIEEATP